MRTENQHTMSDKLSLKVLKEKLLNTNSEEKSKDSKIQTIPHGGIPSPLFLASSSTIRTQYDEVLPNVYLGGSELAYDKDKLKHMGFTHILNAAQGNKFNQVNTDRLFYEDIEINFQGIGAVDFPNYKINQHFTTAVTFITECLKNNGKIYIHCHQGLSRSATLLIAYMMMVIRMPLLEAMTVLRKNRPVLPNDGFLTQLIDLNQELFDISNKSDSEHPVTNCQHDKYSNEIKDWDEITAVVNKGIERVSVSGRGRTTEDDNPLQQKSEKVWVNLNDPLENKEESKMSDLVSNTLEAHCTPHPEVHTLEAAKRLVHDTKLEANDTAQSTHFQNVSPWCPVNSYDLVYPGIYLGDRKLARDIAEMNRLDITNIVNTAQGSKFGQVGTSAEYYRDVNINFYGIPAADLTGFKICEYFHGTADFIKEALKRNEKVYVHCHQGISRSASVVLAFLMLEKNMTLARAIVTVRKRRAVLPNDGFLQQLLQLQNTLFR